MVPFSGTLMGLPMISPLHLQVASVPFTVMSISQRGFLGNRMRRGRWGPSVQGRRIASASNLASQSGVAVTPNKKGQGMFSLALPPLLRSPSQGQHGRHTGTSLQTLRVMQ
jgi:hypothetical protein